MNKDDILWTMLYVEHVSGCRTAVSGAATCRFVVGSQVRRTLVSHSETTCVCVICLFALSDVFHVRLFDCCFVLRTGFIRCFVDGCLNVT